MGIVTKKVHAAKSRNKKATTFNKLTANEKIDLFEKFMIEIGQWRRIENPDGSSRIEMGGTFILNKDLQLRFRDWYGKNNS